MVQGGEGRVVAYIDGKAVSLGVKEQTNKLTAQEAYFRLIDRDAPLTAVVMVP